MGVVYRAVDTRLGRPVAIKVLPAEATVDADRPHRFVREARSASALNHPHIVTIYEIGEDAGTTFIAMELVDGRPLDRLLHEGPLPVATAVDYAVQVASALEAAHARGIVHRDIKPANIVVAGNGRLKVLDFGLAKLIEHPESDETVTARGTLPGIILGTLAYMSPEQAEGRAVDARSDLFSLGAVLFEMLSGRRPFAAGSDAALVTAILRDEPPALRTLREEVPAEVEAIVGRALAKSPADRYATAEAMRQDLAAALARITRAGEARGKRSIVLMPAAALLIVAAGLGLWQLTASRGARWAREVAIPEIERLENADRSLDAVRLARDAERYAPAEVARARDRWLRLDITTDPDGAEVSIRNYLDVHGTWEMLGITPLRSYALPQGLYRLRINKSGYEPLDIGYLPGRPPIKLTPIGAGEPGMVFVPGGPVSFGVAKPVNLPDYWVDKFEVTNSEFKRFVDAGGYREQKFWTTPFRERGRTLAFEEAMERFRDATGRPGPATWALGSHPEGEENFPVGGISWFEAAAYARFANRELLTLHHWYFASGVDEIFSDMLRLSRFDAKGPAAAGTHEAIGPWGAHDMAGNVKEWSLTESEDSGLRYIVGGGWNEPAYRFLEPEARDPWQRDATFGVRLMKTTAPVPDAAARVSHVSGDPASLVPVSAEQFELLRGFYSYDRAPVEGRIDAKDDGSPYWTKESVSYAGPAGERIPAFFFAPKNASPPYQTIVFFPSSYAREIPSSDALDLVTFEFIVRSGRAVIYPVYEGTYERRKPISGTNAARDRNVTWAKEVFRTIDYLETRKDVDTSRIGYYSLSLGAFFGPIPVALEPRIKASVFAAGGLRFNVPPEIQTANFMPRVKTPVLLINGTHDFAVPPAARRRFLELLGSPAEHKKLVELEGGHVPVDAHRFYREALDWYDRYLGAVK